MVQLLNVLVTLTEYPGWFPGPTTTITPVSGDPTTSSDLCGHQAQAQCTYIHTRRQTTHSHKINLSARTHTNSK